MYDRAALHSSNECTKSVYPSHTAECFHTANTITINNPKVITSQHNNLATKGA